MGAALLEVKNLKKYFETPNGLLHAVDGVNFILNEGKTLGIVGESGCGKSTLGRVIVRLLDATDGQVFYKGENILKINKSKMKKMRRDMQIIFQDPSSSLNPRMTVSEIISEPLIENKIYGNNKELENRIRELMNTVGLARRYINTYPHELDGGRRQRIGIARALALKPEFIVCDEPVSALDVSIQAQILNLLMDIQEKEKLTFLFITHDLSVVKHISDEIAVMYLGQIVEKTSSDELFENPKHPYTKALLEAIPIPDLSMKLDMRKTIIGEVTDPIDPKPGCRFAPRCPYRKDECVNGDIVLKFINDDHSVACKLY